MSNWLSRPKEFSPYISSVNPEMYGKLLQQHEQEYEQGVQKIENSDATVIAGLPMSRYDDVNYLQQRDNEITSQLNSQVGADWSNAATVNTVTKHIASLANDPRVQAGVAFTVDRKRGWQGYNDSKDANENKDISNQQKFLYNDNQLMNSTGSIKYNNSIVPFVDNQKNLHDMLQGLHPQKTVKEDIGGAGSANQWDKVKYTVEGVDQSVVDGEIRNYLSTTPGAEDQLSVDSWYQYRNITPDVYVDRMKNANKQSLNDIDVEKQKRIIEASQITDSQKKQDVLNIIAGLDAKTQSINKYDPEQDRQNFEANGDELKKNLYREELIRGMVGRYSYIKDSEVEYGGESPFAKTLAQNKDIRESNKENREEQAFPVDMQLKALELATKSGVNSAAAPVVTQLPITPADKHMAFTNYQNDVLKEGGDVIQSKVNFIANKMNTSGTDIDDYFDKLPNGNYVIKDKTIKTSYGPMKLSNYLLGFIDKSGNIQTGVIDKWSDKARKGDYSADDKGFKLTNYDAESLKNINQSEQLYKSGVDQLSEAVKKSEKDPSVKLLNQKIQYFDTNPVKRASRDGTVSSFNGHDAENFIKAQGEIEKRYYEEIKQLGPGDSKNMGPEYQRILNNLENEIYQKYGLNDKSQIKLMSESPEVTDLSNHYGNAETKKSEILNKFALDNGYTYQPFEMRWTRDYKKDNPALGQYTNQTILNNLKSRIEHQPKGFDAFPQLRKILTDKDNKDAAQADIRWDPAQKKYHVTVYDVKHDPAEDIEIDPSEAESYGIPNIQPSEDYIYKIMQRRGGTTFGKNEGMLFDNALHLHTIGKYDYRVHVIDNGNSYTIQPYRKNTSDNSAPETLPDVTVQSHDFTDVRNQLNKIIYSIGS